MLDPALATYIGVGSQREGSHLNAMVLQPLFHPDGTPDGGATGVEPHPITGGDTADDAVALTANLGSPLMVFNGTDFKGNLYVVPPSAM